MCDVTCIYFAAQQIHPNQIIGRRILEVGSLDVNGSIKRIWKTLDSAE